MSFDKKKLRTRSFDRKFIWPKVYLTESFLSQNDHLTESFFRKMLIWPKGHLTECFLLKNCRFRKVVIWPTVHISLEWYMFLTSSSPPGAVKEKNCSHIIIIRAHFKKIWCASRARVNLPHIGNRECFQFVLQQNLINKT
jgi:hypothetical protein